MKLNGFELLKLDEIDSTNTYVKQNIEALSYNNWIVTANFQFEGKGQNTNKWKGEKNKNLYCSLLIRNDFLASKNPFIINKTIAIATQACIAHFCKQPTFIKWPNDIFVNNKKISGILIENSFLGPKLKHSIIGIGININQIRFDGLNATSLNLLTNTAFSIDDILSILVEYFNRYLQLLRTNKDDLIRQKFDKGLFRINQLSTFEIENRTIHGVIKGCDKNGRLLVEIDGKIKNFGHGEIRLKY